MLHRTALRLALCVLVFISVGNAESSEESTTTEEQQKKPEPPEDKFDAEGHTDWGSYYDPQNIFCGKYDCYAILGFDYGEWATERPSTKQITKRYRALSRAWHPDKSKHKDAKERFVVSQRKDRPCNVYWRFRLPNTCSFFRVNRKLPAPTRS